MSAAVVDCTGLARNDVIRALWERATWYQYYAILYGRSYGVNPTDIQIAHALRGNSSLLLEELRGKHIGIAFNTYPRISCESYDRSNHVTAAIVIRDLRTSSVEEGCVSLQESVRLSRECESYDRSNHVTAASVIHDLRTSSVEEVCVSLQECVRLSREFVVHWRATRPVGKNCRVVELFAALLQLQALAQEPGLDTNPYLRSYLLVKVAAVTRKRIRRVCAIHPETESVERDRLRGVREQLGRAWERAWRVFAPEIDTAARTEHDDDDST